MARTRRPLPIILLASAVLAGRESRTAPARTAPAPGAARTSTGGITLALRDVTLRRTASLALDAPPGAKPSRPQTRTEATLRFALGAREPDLLGRVVLGELSRGRYRALDNRRRPAGETVGRVEETEEGPRLLVTVKGLAPDAAGLSLLEGELRGYAGARRIRFHIPWLKDDLPLTVEFGGAAATLRRFHLVETDSTLWVAVRPPAGYRLAPLAQGGVTARALDIYGNLVNGGGIAETVQTAQGAEPEFRLFAPALQRTPARLMLDVLCVSGEPQALPFRFTDLQFPAPVP